MHVSALMSKKRREGFPKKNVRTKGWLEVIMRERAGGSCMTGGKEGLRRQRSEAGSTRLKTREESSEDN